MIDKRIGDIIGHITPMVPVFMATSLIARDEYTQMLPHIEQIRDGVAGSYAIKRRDRGLRYLPNPTEVDIGSDENATRYASYLKRAEYDEFPGQTLATVLGKLQLEKMDIDLPSAIKHMEEDADGDGRSLESITEHAASECLQVKWCVAVAEYQGLSGLEVETLSKAETDQLNPRSTIKIYERETVIDWEFARRNGVMQLVYIVLRHVGSTFDDVQRVRTPVTSDLVLGLDSDSNYYQQKIVDGAEGAREYVTISGQALKWIPAVFLCDQDFPAGRLPMSMGYMGPIVQAAIQRYQVSADYKDALKYLSPTTYTKGWKPGDIDTFTEANNGRTGIVTGPGGVNNLPGDVDVMTVGGDGDTNDFVKYLDNNERKVRALGGVFKTDDSSDRTATEAALDADDRVAKLQTLVDGLQRGMIKALTYCAMFEGAVRPDAVEAYTDQITFVLPRDFARPVLSPEQVDRVINLVMAGLMTVDQAVRKLVEGGWHMDDAQQVLAELQTSGPDIVIPPRTSAPDEPQAVPAQQ